MRSLLAVLLAVAGGCAAARDELVGLADQPPLPYSVFVTGGAFLTGSDPSAGPLDETFTAEGVPPEPILLDDLAGVLEAGRVYARLAMDAGSGRARRNRLRGGTGGEAAMLEPSFRGRVAGAGHDLVLVLEELRNGPVEEQGVNGRWPVTLVLWLAVGVGMVIPDHTYESTATLRATLRDAHTGQVVYRVVRSSGPVDLSLIERSNFWGLLGSIVIPPFLVPDDAENVVASVRPVASRRLLVSLARQLKSVEARQELADRAAASISLERREGRLWLGVESDEGIRVLRVRVDGRGLDDEVAGELEQRLRSSVVVADGRFLHRVALEEELEGDIVQVLVQTVSGRVSSVTVPLEDVR